MTPSQRIKIEAILKDLAPQLEELQDDIRCAAMDQVDHIAPINDEQEAQAQEEAHTLYGLVLTQLADQL